MSAADDMALVARLRSDAPFSEHGHLYIQAANAIEDANARVALAHADALNAAADWLLNGEATGIIAPPDIPSNRGEVMAAYDAALEDPEGWLRERARAIEVGEI